MRQAIIKYKDIEAGGLVETDDGEYTFSYHEAYIQNYPKQFITFQMPVSKQIYRSSRLFPSSMEVTAVYKRAGKWLPIAIKLIDLSFLANHKKKDYKNLISERVGLFTIV